MTLGERLKYVDDKTGEIERIIRDLDEVEWETKKASWAVRKEKSVADEEEKKLEEPGKISIIPRGYRWANRSEALKKAQQIRDILYSTDEGIDEPHYYRFYVHTGGYSTLESVCNGCAARTVYVPANSYGYEEIMTEREVMLKKALSNVDASIVREMNASSTREYNTIKRKVNIIKNSSEEERTKKAEVRLLFGEMEIVIETDDEHVFLCSLKNRQSCFKTSYDLQREEEERARKEEERAREEEKIKKREERKAHPVRYTFKIIRDTLRSRNRGRE